MLRKPICPHGHDKRIVGVRPNGYCSECDRLRERKTSYPPRVREPFYPCLVEGQHWTRKQCEECGKEENMLSTATTCGMCLARQGYRRAS